MYAWIENGVVRDTNANPAASFHPDIAALYSVEVPDYVGNGYTANPDGTFTAPSIIEQPPQLPAVSTEPEAIKVSPIEFKLLFTPQERVSIKSARATDPVIDDFYDLIEDVRLTHVNLSLPSTQQALAYMAMKGLIAESRIPEILAGNPT